MTTFEGTLTKMETEIGAPIQYYLIFDSNFINVLNQYDFNSKKNDARVSQQLSAFAGIPGLAAKVQQWLSS
jgi:hypothetical protein